VDNEQIADVFEEIAALLELEGSNPFRIMAWQNAARTLRDHTTPMADMVEAGEDVKSLPSIGKDTAAAIEQLVKEGRATYLEELGERVPRPLIQVMRIPGLGPKKAKRLWNELGITDVPSLFAAAREGKIATLKGFGKKSEEGILKRADAVDAANG